MKKILILILCLSLLPLISAGYCYQESATVSTPCGGLDTGSYSSSGQWFYNFEVDKSYDENWDTPSYAFNGTSYLYINYAKPSVESTTAFEGTIWEIKHGGERYNITLPNNCIRDTVQLRIKSASLNLGGYRESQPYCYNGTNWMEIGNNYNGSDAELKWIYEEGIWWKLSEDVNPHEFKLLPQITSNKQLDLEGLERTYLKCFWSIDGIGENFVDMNSDICPEIQQDFTFTNDEDYIIKIVYLDIIYNPTSGNWEKVSDGISGEFYQHYDLNYPEPDLTVWWNDILDILKVLLCQLFPSLEICSS